MNTGKEISEDEQMRAEFARTLPNGAAALEILREAGRLSAHYGRAALRMDAQADEELKALHGRADFNWRRSLYGLLWQMSSRLAFCHDPEEIVRLVTATPQQRRQEIRNCAVKADTVWQPWNSRNPGQRMETR